jgi:hypothetical protein
MRHSSLELTGRYTRPRAVDIEAAASMLPSLKPEGDRPESLSLAMTGIDASPLSPLGSALAARRVRIEPESDGSCRNDPAECAKEGLPEVIAGDGLRREVSAADRIHPTGFEPVTFGSVGDYSPERSRTKTPINLEFIDFGRRCKSQHFQARKHKESSVLWVDSP